MSTRPAHHAHPNREISESVENYVKAVYLLQQRGDAAVTTNAIAEGLGVNAASASAMVRKLADLGYVEHEPYRGVRLTDAGKKVALEVIRHHRLLEAFLHDVLGMPWDRVHAEAEVLEHYISPDLVEAIDVKLGRPTHDPHGDPIPTRGLEVPADETVTLHAMEPGDRGTFVRVSDANPDMLRFLSARGIAPGDTLEVVAKQPFDGPLSVRFGDTVQALGGDLARAMRVERKTSG
jgi:DtxR family Mn-dependent transcriptional regulator